MLIATEIAVLSDPGRQRRDNEDSSYAREPVFVVADGMGGAQAGEVASRMVIDAFRAGLPQQGTPEERLSVVVQRANSEINGRSRSESTSAGMGTTVTAAYLDADAVSIAHVGDSRAYLLRDGELTRLTEDHSLVEELLRGGRLTEEEAADHPQRSVITRAVGIEPIVEIDTWTYPLRSGDVILLCSDGLTSMISEQEVRSELLAATGLDDAARRLIAAANEAGGRDNITVVLFRVGLAAASDASLDQPTALNVVAPPAVEPPPAASGRGATSWAQRGQRPVRPVPRARLQGFRPHVPPGFIQTSSRPREFGRRAKVMVGLTTVLIVLALIGSAGYLASRQLYFLGTNGQGTVVLYRGFPYTLPFGIPLYEAYFISGVPASTIPPQRRATILDHAMRDQASAISLLNAVELGRISR
jgi:protein phosphatase